MENNSTFWGIRKLRLLFVECERKVGPPEVDIASIANKARLGTRLNPNEKNNPRRRNHPNKAKEPDGPIIIAHHLLELRGPDEARKLGRANGSRMSLENLGWRRKDSYSRR
jgi:hypothetical protein